MKNIEVNEVYTLFEEIKGLIKKGNSNNSAVVRPEVSMSDLSVISELTGKLDETIREVRKPVRMEHHHIFSIASSKVFVGVIGIGIICLFCLFMIFHQRAEIATYKDSDLKYRYVKMQGEIMHQELDRLETVFDSKRDSVKIIRKRVTQYEKALIEEAKRLEKARLKEQQAERLKREAETLKHGK